MSRHRKDTDGDVDPGLVVIHTDGACSGNPGPGGWGAILEVPGKGARKEIKGGEPATTNNRMELMAAIMALESLKRPCRVRLVTDSNYVKDGLTKWLPGWKRNGWKTKDRKSVKNAELWTRLDAAAGRHEIAWEWVKGHSGHAENERADALAREGLLEARIAHKVDTIKQTAIKENAAGAAPKPAVKKMPVKNPAGKTAGARKRRPPTA